MGAPPRLEAKVSLELASLGEQNQALRMIITLLESTLLRPLTSVDSKELTQSLSSLDATVTKTGGGGQAAQLTGIAAEECLPLDSTSGVHGPRATARCD